MAVETLRLGPIVGGLTHEGAYLWGKAGGPGHLHAWLGREPDLKDAAPAGQSLPLRPEDGFAGVAPVKVLQPNARYYYDLRLDSGAPDPALEPYPSFITAPRPGDRKPFSFAFGSCFRPMNENGGQIFHSLEKRRQEENLRFWLLLGDQIYADAYKNNGIGRIACTLEDYRSVYDYTWSRPPFRSLLARLPAYMTLDDHEVDDDWTWTDPDRRWAQIPIWDQVIRWLQGRPREERRIPRQRVQDALQAYWEHQGMHAPPFERPPRLNERGQYFMEQGEPGSLAYTFIFGAAAFFVIDTRSMRIKGRKAHTMLGERQWQLLQDWLLDVKDRYPVKFLVSSSAFLFRMWADLARDRWSGFADDRDALLHFIAAHGIEGVYILSGDLHSAQAVRATLYGPQGRSIPVWEFCSSPFEQDPTRLARYTYSPLRSGPVKSQECPFILPQPNFGVVRVGFLPTGEAQIRFRVYGQDGKLLAETGD